MSVKNHQKLATVRDEMALKKNPVKIKIDTKLRKYFKYFMLEITFMNFNV